MPNQVTEVNTLGPRMKMFIPCMEGECPEHMQLVDYDTPNPRYRCMRRTGYSSRRSGGVRYSSDCHFHRHPKSAWEITHWHRSPETVRPKSGRRDAPTRNEWETAI